MAAAAAEGARIGDIGAAVEATLPDSAFRRSRSTSVTAWVTTFTRIRVFRITDAPDTVRGSAAVWSSQSNR